MTYTPARPMRRTGLTEEQRDQLSQLERVARPSSFARGRLAALRLCATDEADKRRVAGLIEKWGPS